MVLVYSFAPAIFLYSRGFEPLSIERHESGAIEFAFSDEARPALRDYNAAKLRLNELVATPDRQ
jgi:hypothetical protein